MIEEAMDSLSRGVINLMQSLDNSLKSDRIRHHKIVLR
jgi:hypothetical protein